MTPAHRAIGERTRLTLTLGAALSAACALVGSGLGLAGAYYMLGGRVSTAEAKAAAAIDAVEKLKTDVTQSLGDLRHDLREVRGDIKTLLQRR